jgi:hypothetical protein
MLRAVLTYLGHTPKIRYLDDFSGQSYMGASGGLSKGLKRHV